MDVKYYYVGFYQVNNVSPSPHAYVVWSLCLDKPANVTLQMFQEQGKVEASGFGTIGMKRGELDVMGPEHDYEWVEAMVDPYK